MDFLRTKTKDGLFLNGAYTKGLSAKSIVVDIHGLSWDFYTTNFYKYFFSKFGESNISFLAGETRGSYKMRLFEKEDGNYFEGGGAFEIFEDSVLDIEAWINKASELGYQNIYLSGYSFGPTKISHYYYKTKDTRIKALIFISPSDIYGLTHNDSEIARHNLSVNEAIKYMKQNEPKALLTQKLWEIESFSAQTYLSLFDNKNSQVFNYLNPDLGFKILSSIDLPVLAVTGSKDEGITIEHTKAMQILHTALNNRKDVKTIVFDGAEHNFNNFEEELFSNVIQFVG